MQCREITAGSDLDVLEIDAATYSKVEQVRELTESLRYGPARDRYKVVVLDEIHRLSRQAFDALLKIVEEPPPHLTFLFATTESEAVPATILSRCQEYRFRRVSAKTVAAHLRQVSDAEGISTSDRALRLIARAGEGSVRDSVALLDQLATFGSGAIGDGDASRLLGGLETGLFEDLLRAVLGGHAAEVSATVRQIEDNGWDPRHSYSQFLGYCRDALHLALGADPGQVDLPDEDVESLRQIANDTGYENLLRLLNQLLASEQLVRRSETTGLALEIAWLRAAELPKLVRLEELLASTPAAASAGRDAAPTPRLSAPQTSAPQPPAPSSTRRPTRPAKTSRRETSRRETSSRGVSAPPAQAAADAPAANDRDDPANGGEDAGPDPSTAEDDSPRDHDRAIPSFLDLVRRKKPSLRAHLDLAELAFSERGLDIVSAPENHLLRDALARSRTLLDEAVAAVWGPQVRWRSLEGRMSRLRADPSEATPAPSRPRPAADAPDRLHAASGHPTVQAVLDIFGGKVESVEVRKPKADAPPPAPNH